MRGQTSGARILAAIGTAILDVSVAAEPARAQDVPLAQLLPQLILSGITLDSPSVRFVDRRNDLCVRRIGRDAGLRSRVTTATGVDYAF